MALKQAVEKLKNAVGDLTSLEVQTISGSMSADLATQKPGQTAEVPQSGGSIIDWKKAVADAKKVNGTVELVLATKINFDGDATQFVRKDEIPPHMLDAHKKAVEAGLQVRRDIVEFVSETIRGFLK